MQTTKIQAIASTIDALKHCLETKNTEWIERHRARLSQLERTLPSGSGIDCGTKIAIDKSNADRVVLTFSYHHMNEAGFYEGWTEHTAIIRPAFNGLNIRITGSNRNDCKEYFHEVYHHDLQAEVEL
jgi:hypothetical protein